MKQRGRLPNGHSWSSEWRKSLLLGAPTVLCSSTEPEPPVMGLRLHITLSLVAKESEPAFDERLGFSKIYGFQHSSQT